MMRVCLLAPEFLPNRGGVGTYSVDLSKELGRLVDLTVVTLTRQDGSRSYSATDMERAIGGAARVLSISEARDSFLYNVGFQSAVLRRLPAILARERFDIVHSQHAHMPDILLRLVRRTPPVVRTIHTTIAGQRDAIRLAERFGGSLEASERWQVALEPGLRAAEWFLLGRGDRSITVSHWMKRLLVEQGMDSDRLVVVHNGVDAQRFQPRNGSSGAAANGGGCRVFFPGRPTLVKGGGVFAQAAPKILAAAPKTRFLFAGGSPGELQSLMSRAHLPAESTQWLGFVPYETLPDVYASMDVVVAPTFYENLPFRVLEAMACGVAVVASDVCGIPEAITSGENGVLVPPGDSEALAEAVTGLIADEPRRRRLGQAARRTAEERFTWTTAARQTVDLYRSAVAETGG